MNRKFFSRFDIVAILVVLALSAIGALVFSMLPAKGGEIAEIYHNSQLVMTVNLSECAEEEFVLPQNENVVFHTSSDGRIRFERSSCPDKICVNYGWLRRSGEVAACLPNGFVLKIVSPDAEHDTIIGS